MLPNGDVLVGWGSEPYYTEFRNDGTLVLDAEFAEGQSYRAFRFPWIGTPTEVPAVAVSRDGVGHLTVYASWNGSIRDRHSGRPLRGCGAPRSWPCRGRCSRTGFETLDPWWWAAPPTWRPVPSMLPGPCWPRRRRSRSDVRAPRRKLRCWAPMPWVKCGRTFSGLTDLRFRFTIDIATPVLTAWIPMADLPGSGLQALLLLGREAILIQSQRGGATLIAAEQPAFVRSFVAPDPGSFRQLWLGA